MNAPLKIVFTGQRVDNVSRHKSQRFSEFTVRQRRGSLQVVLGSISGIETGSRLSDQRVAAAVWRRRIGEWSGWKRESLSNDDIEFPERRHNTAHFMVYGIRQALNLVSECFKVRKQAIFHDREIVDPLIRIIANLIGDRMAVGMCKIAPL